MSPLNLVLIGIIAALGIALALVVMEYWQTAPSSESVKGEKLNVEDLIETFKEKYSDREIVEIPDSKGVPYKYIARADGTNDVELLLERDRVVLKAWRDDDVRCIVSDPMPRDILNNCPLKW